MPRFPRKRIRRFISPSSASATVSLCSVRSLANVHVPCFYSDDIVIVVQFARFSAEAEVQWGGEVQCPGFEAVRPLVDNVVLEFDLQGLVLEIG